MAKFNIQNLIDCESEVEQLTIIRVLNSDIASVEVDETELIGITYDNCYFVLSGCDFQKAGFLSVGSGDLEQAISFLNKINAKVLLVESISKAERLYDNHSFVVTFKL